MPVFTPTVTAGAAPSSYPDATNTGHLGANNPRLGTELTTHNGDFTTSSASQVVQDLKVIGRIIVNHDNVTIRNCWVQPTSEGNGIDNVGAARTGGRMTIEDTTVDGSLIAVNDTHGLSIAYYNATRVNVFGWSKGAECWGNTNIEDSYFHDFAVVGEGAHREGLHPYQGTNIELVHNTVIMDRSDGSSGVIYGGVFPEENPRYVLIDDNLLYGDGSQPVIGMGDTMTATNNKILDGSSTNFFVEGGGTASHCGTRWFDGASAGQLVAGESAC